MSSSEVSINSLILKNLSSMLYVELHRVALRITGQRLVHLLSLADLLMDDNFLIRSLIFERFSSNFQYFSTARLSLFSVLSKFLC